MRTFTLSLLLGAVAFVHVGVAAEYELRLVPYDDPSGDLQERVRSAVTWSQFYYSLSEREREESRAPYVCWARNVLLDGQPAFEIYERGRYIDRLPITRPRLRPGKHTLWPGDHVFTVEGDGSVKTEDPDLLISTEKLGEDRVRHVVRMKCYPITIRAENADPRARKPANLLEEIPLPKCTLREAADNEKALATEATEKVTAGQEVRELLPDIRGYLWLTAWLPSNKAGKGYVIHPLKETFHLGAEGLFPGAGEGYHIPSWRVEGYEVTIPVTRFPVRGDPKMEVLVGKMQKVSFPERGDQRTRLANLYNRQDPYQLRVSNVGPGLLLEGDLSKLPRKLLRLDWSGPEELHQRCVLVETEKRHLTLGQRLRARVRGLDPSPAVKANVPFQKASKEAQAAGKRLTAARRSLDQANQQLGRAQPKVAAAQRNEERARQQVEREQKALEAAKAKGQKPQIDAAAKKLADAQADLKAKAQLVKQELAAAAGLDQVKKAKTGVENASKALATAEVALRDAEDQMAAEQKALEAVADRNLLADAVPFAQLRARRSRVWAELGLEARSGGTLEIAIPDTIADGVYELRLGVRPRQLGQTECYADQWVTVAAGEVNGIGVFTQRGRTAFYRGEQFWVAVSVIACAAPIPAQTPIAVDLVDAQDTRLQLYRDAIAQEIRDRDTLILDIGAATSLALAPGPYRVEARVGERVSPAFHLEIVDPTPRTHFTNLLLGKYNSLGKDYSTVLSCRHEAPEEVARAIAGSGYNAFQGMTYAIPNRVVFPDGGDLAQLVRERPELGPPEAFALPSGRDRFLNTAVRHNLRFYENLFTQHDSIMPRGEKMLAVCERYATLEAQSMRHSPAFRGVCAYDELSQSLDHDSHMAVLSYFRSVDEMTYRRKHGHAPAEALRALDRFTGRPEGQRRYEDVARYRTWPAHLDWQWEDLSARISRAVKRVVPDAVNLGLARISALPGSTLQWGVGTREGVFRPLQAAATVGYKDMGGYGPFVMGGPLAADALRTRDDLLVWPMLVGAGTGKYGAPNLRQAFFTLSQKVDGLSFMQFGTSPEAKSHDNFNGVRDITDLTTRYGDLFLATQKGYRKVAIFYSREADLLGLRKPNRVALACECLWTACMRAGFPADLLTDSQIRADKGLDYQVIFVPGITFKEEVPPETMAALKRLKAAGRILVVGRHSRLDLDGIVRLDSDFDEMNDRVGGSFPKHLDHDDERWWDLSVKTTALVRSFLAKHVPPAAEHDLLVGPDWLRCRQAEYLVIPNFAHTEFTGNHKALYQAPNRPTIRFPARPPVCYDMLEMQRVDVGTSEDGQTMSLPIDLRHYPGKLYAFLPAAIESLILRAPAAIQGGRALSYEVAAAGPQGKRIDAGIPLEITLTAPSGKLLQKVYRAGTPVYRGAYVVPANLRQGDLKLYVRELLSGTLAEATVKVTEGRLPRASKDARVARVHEPNRLRQFIAKDLASVKPQFTKDDLLHAGRLALRIRDGEDALSKYLRSRFDAGTQKLLDGYDGKDEEPAALSEALLEELNRTVMGERLYTDERFPPGILSVETGRLGQITEDRDKLPDLHRQLLEEHYAQEIVRRHPVYIAVTEEWVRPQAERLRQALHARGVRARATMMQPYLRGPGRMILENEILNLDGTRLWRGEVVRPGVHVDGPLIILGREADLVARLAAQDLLPEPASRNFPGPGRAVLTWVPKAFSVRFDTVAVLASDENGLAKGIEALLGVSRQVPGTPTPSRPAEPAFDEQATLAATTGKGRTVSSLRETLRFEDRIETLDIDPSTGALLVGTFGFGDNLFCFSREGELLWKTFLPEHDVYFSRWYGDRRVVAATAHGFHVFLLDGSNGTVLRKFASTEWPDFHVGERETNTKVRITINPKLRQILILGRTGVLAVDYDGNRMWFHDRAFDIARYPQDAAQPAFAEFGTFLKVGSAAPSPDGTKLAYNETRYFASTEYMQQIIPLWRNEPQILDARTGKVLLRCLADPGSNDAWEISWPPDSAVPWIHARNLSAPLHFAGPPGPDGIDGGKLGQFVPPLKRVLKTGGTLEKDHRSCARVSEAGLRLWQVHDEHFWVSDLDSLNESDTRLYRCSRDGWVRCIDLPSGQTLWEHKLHCVARLLPVAQDQLLAGARNGEVVRFDASGKVVWRARLRDHHQVPERNYPKHIAAAERRDRDDTPTFYPTSDDAPGDYKGVLRMGMQQLDNGDFETDQGWVSPNGPIQLGTVAKSGKKSLRLAAGQLATYTVSGKLIPSATYLLEFLYRTEAAETRLAAGASLTGGKPVFTLSNFVASPGEWAFGRVAIKTMADTTAIDVGFEAGGGDAHVDAVTLRPVRFPSANLLANEELHQLEPTHPEDYRVRYRRIPSQLEERLLNRNRVASFLQATPLGALVLTQEQAFLHNGRLDDIGTMWCYRPDAVGFAVVLTKPAYVSHLVLYLNNSIPDAVYPNISIQANDLDSKIPRTVALVRGNRRRFIVVHFPETLYTDNFKILPGRTRTQRDCLTEVEVYGPVGGPEMLTGKKFAADALATPMFMGAPSHVSPSLPDDLVGKFKEVHRHNFHYAPAIHPSATAVDAKLTFAQALGRYEAVPITNARQAEFKQEIDQRRRQGERDPFIGWRIGSVTPLTTPARYAGRLLAGSADYRMHAVADNGTHIWAFETGGRIYSSPTPDKDEVYFGSDDGHLYKVDVDSGILIWEFKTGDRLRSSPALDGKRVYVASWDGFLYAVDMVKGTEAWKVPIARYTRSSPAVHQGRVYIGDEEGKFHCVDANAGKSLWQASLGGRVSMCPIVTPEGVFVASEGGDAALVSANGVIKWKRDIFQAISASAEVPPRLTGQPFATKTQFVVPSTQGLHVLKRQDGAPDPRFVPPAEAGNVVSAIPYGLRLCLIQNGTHLQGDWTRFIVAHGAAALIWEPEGNAKGK